MSEEQDAGRTPQPPPYQPGPPPYAAPPPPGPPPYAPPPPAGPPPYAPPYPRPDPQQQPGPAPGVDEEGWRRLDARLLVIGPVRTLGSFALPLLLSLIGIGTQAGAWTLLVLPVALAAAFALGALPWWTTTYRETPTHLELRTGLLNRSRQTAPRDRVRSVDVTTPLLHRLLGVTKVEIGTGVDDSRIELQVVTTAEAARMRAELLGPRTAARPTAGHPAAPQVAGAPTASPYAGGSPHGPYAASSDPAAQGWPAGGVPAQSDPGHDPGHEPEQELARLRWSWLRFAPLNLAQLAIVAGALGASSQFLDDLPIWDVDHLQDAWAWLLEQVLVLVLAVAALGALVAWLAFSLIGYTLQWGGFRLVREPAQREGETALRMTAGLLTTRSISVEERRVRGVRIEQPALMRLAGGGDLATLATGVEEGTTKVLPHCPLPVVLAVGNDVLGTPREAGPLVVPLQAHGPAARRRAHVRWQWTTLLLGAGAVVATLALDGPLWAPLAVVVALAVLGAGGAELSYRNLGHALTRRDDGSAWHLVAGSGGYTRVRTVLEVDGVIGWVVAESFFQRRLGLCDLVATTAAGGESVRVRDVPTRDGLALAHGATPPLVETFAAAA